QQRSDELRLSAVTHTHAHTSIFAASIPNRRSIRPNSIQRASNPQTHHYRAKNGAKDNQKVCAEFVTILNVKIVKKMCETRRKCLKTNKIGCGCSLLRLRGSENISCLFFCFIIRPRQGARVSRGSVRG